MKFNLLFFVLLLSSFYSAAQQPLSKALVEQYFSTTESFSSLDNKYPALKEQWQGIMQLSPDAALAKIKKFKAYGEMETIVKSAGYKGFDEFYHQSNRIIASMFSAQLQRMPAGMDDMETRLNDTIAQMRKNGVAEDMINKMKKEMSEQGKQYAFMKNMANSASEEDRAFMNQNMAWIMSILPSEPN